jgi:hypothetical protein
VIVVAHQAPCEDLPTIQIADVTSSFYKFGGFVDVAEHEFAARDTAIHVVGGSGKK